MKKNILCLLLFLLAGNICLAQTRQPEPAALPAAGQAETTGAASEETPALKIPEQAPLAQTETAHTAGETWPSGSAPEQKPPMPPAQKEEKTLLTGAQEKKEPAPSKPPEKNTVKEQPEPADTHKTAIERRHRQARILANLAIDLMAHDNYELAEKKLHEARQTDPNLASIYCNLALFDWRAENREAAFMNIETCFMKGFKDFNNIEEDADFGEIVADRRYKALKNRYQ